MSTTPDFSTAQLSKSRGIGALRVPFFLGRRPGSNSRKTNSGPGFGAPGPDPPGNSRRGSGPRFSGPEPGKTAPRGRFPRFSSSPGKSRISRGVDRENRKTAFFRVFSEKTGKNRESGTPVFRDPPGKPPYQRLINLHRAKNAFRRPKNALVF
jgi:hypothetical protein